MKTQFTTPHNANRPFAMTASSRKPFSALLTRLLWAAALALPVFGVQAAVVFTTLYSFTGTNDGANPSAALVQGSDGNFYGTTSGGGTNFYYNSVYGTTYGCGTVFKISTNGALTTLYAFGSITNANGEPLDGIGPNGLVQGSDGSFYGTTLGGWNYGEPGYGTVFKINTNGALTTLYTFGTNTDAFGRQLDGNGPNGLVQGSDGFFYGTTQWGGTNYLLPEPCDFAFGNVFKISSNGALTSLYSFGSIRADRNAFDGANPQARLLQGSDVYLYGTTSRGGSYGTGNGLLDRGTVFKISITGAMTHLYSFPGGDDVGLPNGLVRGSDGNFYGTTQGWMYGNTLGFPLRSPGTVFKISPDGVLTILHFLGGNDGMNPQAALVQGSDGYFYGTTEANDMWFFDDSAGFIGAGTVFRINTNGTLTTLYAFGSVTNASGVALDGANPCAALVQGSDGSFYGTTTAGGTYDNGTIFRLTIVPDPQLTIIPCGPYVIVTWPTNYGAFSYAGYTLHSTTNFASTNWATVSPGPVVIGGQNVVINTICGTQRFFRLSQ